jgi:hypothetical protein
MITDADAILRYLDERFEKFEMPCLGNMNIDYLAVRLHVYTSPQRDWMLLFDSVVWWPGLGGIAGMIELVGPGVDGEQGFSDGRLTEPAKIETDDDGLEVVSVVVRGGEIAPDDLDVRADEEISEDVGFWASVALLAEHREALLTTAQERARFIPAGFERVLVLDEWQHPDFDCPPSATDTFRAIAQAIASNEFAAFPASANPNTHWSKWVPK